jgi:hypothetical protein
VPYALRHENLQGIVGTAPPFLTSAPDGGERSPSRPCSFTPGERVPGTHWIGGWIGPRSGLDTVEKTKSFTAGNRTSAVQSVARRYTDCAIPNLIIIIIIIMPVTRFE